MKRTCIRCGVIFWQSEDEELCAVCSGLSEDSFIRLARIAARVRKREAAGDPDRTTIPRTDWVWIRGMCARRVINGVFEPGAKPSERMVEEFWRAYDE